MISFSNLYEAVVQQPTPPKQQQQPVQQTGQQNVQQQQPTTQQQSPQQQDIQAHYNSLSPEQQQMVRNYYQQYYQQYGTYPQYPYQVGQQEQQPQGKQGLWDKIKAGYEKVDNAWGMGKDVVKGVIPIAAQMAMPFAMPIAKNYPNLGNFLHTAGMVAMYAPRMASIPDQTVNVVSRAKAKNFQTPGQYPPQQY